MRISDWSSDVCSSDLWRDDRRHLERFLPENRFPHFRDALETDSWRNPAIRRRASRRPQTLPQASTKQPIWRFCSVMTQSGHCAYLTIRIRAWFHAKGEIIHGLISRSEEHTSELQS